MEEKLVSIYIIIDPFTKKARYVGKTGMTLKKRLKCHLVCKHNKEKVEWLKSIIEKGSFPIIKEIDRIKNSEWVDAEKYWIKYYREFYGDMFNILDGGGHTIVVKRKPHTEEFKRFISDIHKGHKYNLGKKDSLETRLKKSESLKRSHRDGKMKDMIQIMNDKIKRPIIQYTKNGDYLMEFSSITEASIRLGIKRTAITENVRGVNKTSGGFIFKYKSLKRQDLQVTE